jgi:hypothetical protein
MGNQRRGRDSRGNLRKMTADQKLARGSKRMSRAERRGDVALFGASFPHPGVVSRTLFGDSRMR